MGSRLKVHEILCDILGSRHVYYQPPESLKMDYPAIVYSRDNIVNSYADNRVHAQAVVYKVVVIDKDPDSIVVERLSKLPTCHFESHYVADNLNHDVFTLFYLQLQEEK